MGDIFSLIFPFFGLVGLGYGAAKIKKLPLEALNWMNTFIIYIALPALFFNLLSKTPVEELTRWRFILATTLGTFIAFSLMYSIALWRSKGHVAQSAIQAFAAAYGNIGFMAPGLALLAFGEAAVVPVALIFCFDNTLHFVLAPLLMGIAGREKTTKNSIVTAYKIVKKIVLHPFILATIVGVSAALFEVQPPQGVSTLITYLADAAAPCALFAMGVTLALRPMKRVPTEAGFVVCIKLILQPIIILILVLNFGDFPDVWIYSAVLIAGLPTATNVYVIAQQYDVWVERASAMVLITTTTSIITLTGLLYIIKSGILAALFF